MGLLPDNDPVRARFTRCNGCRRVTRSYLGMPGFCECMAGTTDLGWKQLVQTLAGRRVWKYPHAIKPQDRPLTWGELSRPGGEKGETEGERDYQGQTQEGRQ